MTTRPDPLRRALFVATLIIAPGLGAQQPRANLILVNGRVLTVDSADRIVSGGRHRRQSHRRRRDDRRGRAGGRA